MPFKISVLDGAPKLDSLPVAKITDYPLEKADYKPFAQARICLTPDLLLLQLWAFEANPSPQSSLRAVLTAPGAAHPLLTLELWSTGVAQTTLTRDGQTLSPEEVGLQPPALESLWGEDLQGVYWGGGFTLNRAELSALWGAEHLSVGGVLLGNLYKLSTDADKPHSGSLFPADFAGGNPFGLSSLGEFQLVSY